MTTGLRYALVEGWERPSEKGYPKRSVSDVAVDSRDRVYLYTRDENEIAVFDRDGNYVTAWGRGQFRGRAHGITVGPDDSVYCVNDLEHTIRKFTPSGELLMTIGTVGVCSDTGYDRTVQLWGNRAPDGTSLTTAVDLTMTRVKSKATCPPWEEGAQRGRGTMRARGSRR